VKWYRKAAEQGVTQAQFNLGVAYAKGQGIPLDFVQAHKWFNLAALHGDGSAGDILDYVTQLMTPDQTAEAARLALEWLKKHRY
jgi:TPR repeat protein